MNHEYELRKLVKLGQKMRSAQRIYFNNMSARNKYTLLNNAKEAEAAFDRNLNEIQVAFVQPKIEFKNENTEGK